MSAVELIMSNNKLLAQDAAFRGCIAASQREGAVEAQQIIANGIAMIAWGLSVAAGDGDVEDLREKTADLVAALEPVQLQEAA